MPKLFNIFEQQMIEQGGSKLSRTRKHKTGRLSTTQEHRPNTVEHKYVHAIMDAPPALLPLGDPQT